MFIVFDTETTGLIQKKNAKIEELEFWPRVVQLAWQIHDKSGNLLRHEDFLIQPNGFKIPYDAEKVHGISTELAETTGKPLVEVLDLFLTEVEAAEFLVGHNLKYDLDVLSSELFRLGRSLDVFDKAVLDTCTEDTAQKCQLPGGKGKKFKLPTLSELYFHLFKEGFNEAHNATADVEASARCFFELLRTHHFSADKLAKETSFFVAFNQFQPQQIKGYGITHVNLKQQSDALKSQKIDFNDGLISDYSERLKQASFSHLHNHSQFTVLQSTATIDEIVQRAVEFNMPAVALTDTANLMGAFHFCKAVHAENAKKREEALEKDLPHEDLLAIIGCEFNVCRDMHDKKNKDLGYQVVFLAKNKNGYQQLVKLSSLAHTQGMYYVPRIDKQAILNFKEDLIVLSGHLNGEIPGLLLNVGETQAEESLLWWKEHFGQDFYLELCRHGLEKEDYVNEVLVRFSKQHQVNLVASNNTYYVKESDAEAHDVLLCVKENELVSTPIGKGRGLRMGFENSEYYFKSQKEMKALFRDLPEAIENIQEIIQKCESYDLARDVLLPAFDIPDEFIDSQDKIDGGKRGENNYLRHLTYEGAKKRYELISDEIRERLDFELATIERTGYPGYFLIVQDFCNAAREMGVSVGPGRGSAAGSAVAYCTGITNVDPIAYDLLFERFLNPDRVSMPDIDIDFDDEGRGKVIDWVIEKYGSNQVAQIITYGTMAAKSSIRDTARVMDLPLQEADRLAKLMPDISLKSLLTLPDIELAEKLKNNNDDFSRAKELRLLHKGNSLASKVIQQASQIEGSIRNTGIHACGVIITPDDITKFVPIATAKDSKMYCTQFDNSVAESAGLLKMDFLGLKTLTLIKDAVKNVEKSHGIKLDPDAFPIDDEKTYALFQKGETVGIFQYESAGMQKYMRELKPTVFADLIAMNALYRPGPLEYIPSFIRRKHGEEPIEYDLPECEEYLKETYGITVYQEQVMLLSQKLAGFSKGEADTLRKAMGKKQKNVLDKMKPSFMERGQQNGHPLLVLEKIWKDWEAFASYAFNKSHSTCYAWVAYQTAYLKANYPAEYMASVLSNNMNDLKQVTFFIEECRRMGIHVLGPDVNESVHRFTVNAEGSIRFGLGAIKGLGSSPVEEILTQRNTQGEFNSIFDFASRLNPRVLTKSTLESIAYAGGFDAFGSHHRAQFFHLEQNGRTFLDTVIRYGKEYQVSSQSPQGTIWDGLELGESDMVYLPIPQAPNVSEWGSIYKLKKEKEVVGIYLSGHPLDDFKIDIESFCNGTVSMLNNMEDFKGRDLVIPGVIAEVEHRQTRNGENFGTLILEDYTDSYKLFLWRESYLKFKHFLEPGSFLAVMGRVEQSRRRNELEFVLSKIELLPSLRERRSKGVRLQVPLKSVTVDFVNELNKLCLNFPGNCPLQIRLSDGLDGTEVNMVSRAVRVAPENDFFKALERLAISYAIVT
jgi:DNA polymerase-3 subunit alpha